MHFSCKSKVIAVIFKVELHYFFFIFVSFSRDFHSHHASQYLQKYAEARDQYYWVTCCDKKKSVQIWKQDISLVLIAKRLKLIKLFFYYNYKRIFSFFQSLIKNIYQKMLFSTIYSRGTQHPTNFQNPKFTLFFQNSKTISKFAKFKKLLLQVLRQ